MEKTPSVAASAGRLAKKYQGCSTGSPAPECPSCGEAEGRAFTSAGGFYLPTYRPADDNDQDLWWDICRESTLELLASQSNSLEDSWANRPVTLAHVPIPPEAAFSSSAGDEGVMRKRSCSSVACGTARPETCSGGRKKVRRRGSATDQLRRMNSSAPESTPRRRPASQGNSCIAETPMARSFSLQWTPSFETPSYPSFGVHLKRGAAGEPHGNGWTGSPGDLMNHLRKISAGTGNGESVGFGGSKREMGNWNQFTRMLTNGDANRRAQSVPDLVQKSPTGTRGDARASPEPQPKLLFDARESRSSDDSAEFGRSTWQGKSPLQTVSRQRQARRRVCRTRKNDGRSDVDSMFSSGSLSSVPATFFSSASSDESDAGSLVMNSSSKPRLATNTALAYNERVLPSSIDPWLEVEESPSCSLHARDSPAAVDARLRSTAETVCALPDSPRLAFQGSSPRVCCPKRFSVQCSPTSQQPAHLHSSGKFPLEGPRSSELHDDWVKAFCANRSRSGDPSAGSLRDQGSLARPPTGHQLAGSSVAETHASSDRLSTTWHLGSSPKDASRVPRLIIAERDRCGSLARIAKNSQDPDCFLRSPQDAHCSQLNFGAPGKLGMDGSLSNKPKGPSTTRGSRSQADEASSPMHTYNSPDRLPTSLTVVPESSLFDGRPLTENATSFLALGDGDGSETELSFSTCASPISPVRVPSFPMPPDLDSQAIGSGVLPDTLTENFQKHRCSDAALPLTDIEWPPTGSFSLVTNPHLLDSQPADSLDFFQPSLNRSPALTEGEGRVRSGEAGGNLTQISLPDSDDGATESRNSGESDEVICGSHTLLCDYPERGSASAVAATSVLGKMDNQKVLEPTAPPANLLSESEVHGSRQNDSTVLLSDEGRCCNADQTALASVDPEASETQISEQFGTVSEGRTAPDDRRYIGVSSASPARRPHGASDRKGNDDPSSPSTSRIVLRPQSQEGGPAEPQFREPLGAVEKICSGQGTAEVCHASGSPPAKTLSLTLSLSIGSERQEEEKPLSAFGEDPWITAERADAGLPSSALPAPTLEKKSTLPVTYVSGEEKAAINHEIQVDFAIAIKRCGEIDHSEFIIEQGEIREEAAEDMKPLPARECGTSHFQMHANHATGDEDDHDKRDDLGMRLADCAVPKVNPSSEDVADVAVAAGAHLTGQCTRSVSGVERTDATKPRLEDYDSSRNQPDLEADKSQQEPRESAGFSQDDWEGISDSVLIQHCDNRSLPREPKPLLSQEDGSGRPRATRSLDVPETNSLYVGDEPVYRKAIGESPCYAAVSEKAGCKDNNLRRDLDDALGDSIVDEFGDVLPLGSQEMAQFEQYDRPTSPVDSPVKDEDPAQQASAGPTAAFGVADTDALIRTLSAAGGGFMTGRNAPIKMAPTDRLAKQANALLVPPQPIFNALETEKSTCSAGVKGQPIQGTSRKPAESPKVLSFTPAPAALFTPARPATSTTNASSPGATPGLSPFRSAKGSRLPMPSAEAMQLARKRLFADLDDDLPSEPGAYGFGTNGDGAAATGRRRTATNESPTMAFLPGAKPPPGTPTIGGTAPAGMAGPFPNAPKVSLFATGEPKTTTTPRQRGTRASPGLSRPSSLSSLAIHRPGGLYKRREPSRDG